MYSMQSWSQKPTWCRDSTRPFSYRALTNFHARTHTYANTLKSPRWRTTRVELTPRHFPDVDNFRLSMTEHGTRRRVELANLISRRAQLVREEELYNDPSLGLPSLSPKLAHGPTFEAAAASPAPSPEPQPSTPAEDAHDYAGRTRQKRDWIAGCSMEQWLQHEAEKAQSKVGHAPPLLLSLFAK
eukprot:NODE_2056_length_998_cov_15.148577_g1678_i0.p1 GENE.NODE_2056_length_998_cov_15.148577_g1678_i0~~NODE_2056_length_998_cov_15.148577_g1678_i0.p1  ORF type:complete len:185 (-),score=23.63 NODE_2056_length_998_cov_15.148577_g1678_i0:219-773(-)